MLILISKLGRWVTSVGLRAFLSLLVVFFLFYAIHSLWPRVRSEWIAVDKKERMIRQKREQVSLLEGEVSQHEQQQETLTFRLMHLEETINELNHELARKREIFDVVMLRKAEELRKDINSRKTNRPYFANWRYVGYDAKTKALEGQLILLERVNIPKDDPTSQARESAEQERAICQQELATTSDLLNQSQAQLQDTSRQLALLVNTSSWMAELRSTWNAFYPWIITIVVGIFLLPLLWALAKFYPIAWLSTRQSPLCFAGDETTKLLWTPPEKTATIYLQPGQKLYARSEWLVQHDGISKRTKIFWNSKSIATSLSSGLVLCTAASNETQKPQRMALGSNSPDEQITEIGLQESAEIILHPHRIVAIQGPITVRAVWRLTNLHAWLTGQIRYLVFKGPGSIFLVGHGGIEGVELRASKQHLEQHLTVGFDSQLSYSVRRTETLVPYLLGKSPLFEDCFEGNGVFLRENATRQGKQTAYEKTFGAIFSVFGKLLGF